MAVARESGFIEQATSNAGFHLDLKTAILLKVQVYYNSTNISLVQANIAYEIN